MLATPVLGPLAKAAITSVSPDSSPQEAALPITRLPFLGLPSLVPIPNLERLYIRPAPSRCHHTLPAAALQHAQHLCNSQRRRTGVVGLT